MQLSDRDAYFEDRELLKWILGRYRHAQDEYDMLIELQDKLEAQRMNPSGSGNGYSDMPHGSGGGSNLPESNLIRLEELEEKIVRKSLENERIMNEVFEIVDCIQEQTPEHKVLFGYYVHAWTWDETARRLHYNDGSYCRKIRNKALDMLLACSTVRYIMYNHRPAYERWCLSQPLNGGREIGVPKLEEGSEENEKV